MKITKYLILLSILLIAVQAFSQGNKRKSHGGNKKESKQFVITINAGMAYGEASNSYETASFYGPHFSVGVRQRMIKLSKNYNFSLDMELGSQLAFLENDKKMYGYQVAQVLFNFNALAGAFPPNKNTPITFPIGFFIGPGIYVLRGGYGVTDVGPMFDLGLRFKMSKTYFFDLKFFGAFIVFGETAIGGATLQFPFKLKKTSGGR